MGSVQFSMFSATLPVQGEKTVKGVRADEAGLRQAQSSHAACEENFYEKSSGAARLSSEFKTGGLSLRTAAYNAARTRLEKRRW